MLLEVVPIILPVPFLTLLYWKKVDLSLKFIDPGISAVVILALQTLLLIKGLYYFDLLMWGLPILYICGTVISLDKDNYIKFLIYWTISSLLLYIVPYQEGYFNLAHRYYQYTESYYLIQRYQYPLIQLCNVILFSLIYGIIMKNRELDLETKTHPEIE